ncbi:MAG: hypothetical protein JKY61_06450 [Planctomycetes bacterium]|nr:hypothetical protein [Planctomycetota bacterium]
MFAHAAKRGALTLFAAGMYCVAAQAQVHVKKGAVGGNGADWLTPYGEMSTAIDAIAANLHTGETELYVAEGTYYPGTLTTDFFQLPNGYSVYGGFLGQTSETAPEFRLGSSANTILSGDIDNTPGTSGNSAHVVLIVGSVPLLDGFTIRDGFAGGHSFPLSGTGGGLVIWGTGPTAAGVSSLDMMVDCHFRDNTALRGGGIGGQFASMNMKFCSFHRNLAKDSGGAIWFDEFGPESFPLPTTTKTMSFFNSNFTNNVAGTESANGRGSAISLTNLKGIVHVYNSRFVDNVILGQDGAGTVSIGHQGSKAATGGTTANDVLFGHCSFAANQAVSGASTPGIYFGDGRFFNIAPKSIQNSILFFNGGATVLSDSNIGGPGGRQNRVIVSSSDIQMPAGSQSPWVGTGNIMLDPQFVDFGLRNLELIYGSPCINTGSNGAILADVLNLDEDLDVTERTPYDLKRGNLRISTPLVPIGSPPPPPASTDMGCHEVQGDFQAP